MGYEVWFSVTEKALYRVYMLYNVNVYDKTGYRLAAQSNEWFV